MSGPGASYSNAALIAQARADELRMMVLNDDRREAWWLGIDRERITEVEKMWRAAAATDDRVWNVFEKAVRGD